MTGRDLWGLVAVLVLLVLLTREGCGLAEAQSPTPTWPTPGPTTTPFGTPAPVTCWPAKDSNGIVVAWACYVWLGSAWAMTPAQGWMRVGLVPVRP